MLCLLAGVLAVPGPAVADQGDSVGARVTTITGAAEFPVGPSGWLRATTHLSARVGPARVRSGHYVYRVRGHVRGRFVPDAATCTGPVTLTVRHGGHRLKRRTTHVGARCEYRFRIRVSALRLPADHIVTLTFRLHYRGNPCLTPAAATRHAEAG